MAFTQGSPLPDITTTTSKTTTAPTDYTAYTSALEKAGTTALGRTGNQLVAGYDPLQTAGYGALSGAATAYKPQLSAAEQTVGKVAGGISPEQIQSFMNPYTQNVVDEMGRLTQQNIQRNLLPNLKAGFVSTGGLGGQRYANAFGQSMADVQANLTGQQQGALSSGYQNAVQSALQQDQLMNQAGQLQSQMAGQEQNLALTGAGALTKAGAERQAYEQSKLDAPLNIAKQVSTLMQGQQVPLNTTQTVTGPGQQGQYRESDLKNLASLTSLIGSAGAGKAGSLLSDLYNRFITPSSSFDKNALPSNVSMDDYYAAINGWSKQSDGSYVDSEGNPVD
jgi:hypothetical protein